MDTASMIPNPSAGTGERSSRRVAMVVVKDHVVFFRPESPDLPSPFTIIG